MSVFKEYTNNEIASIAVEMDIIGKADKPSEVKMSRKLKAIFNMYPHTMWAHQFQRLQNAIREESYQRFKNIFK